VAAFLLITTLMTIAGLVATMIAGYLATPGHVAQHILFALPTMVVGLFSQSMTMFFFIGTGKEIKDKVKGIRDEGQVVQQTRVFKSKVFPSATYAMAAIMATFILGGGVATHRTPTLVHHLLAVASVLLYARAYWIQLHAMDENARLMERYLQD
jgi:Sec-independent protein secretion pathway component TatC